MVNGRKVHPKALPNYQNAVIPRNKLRGYVLSTSHLSGRHKAIVFNSALGFNQSNADRLEQSIPDELPFSEAMLKGKGPWGQKYEVTLSVTGPNNNSADVLPIWIIRPDADYPSLVTTYVK